MYVANWLKKLYNYYYYPILFQELYWTHGDLPTLFGIASGQHVEKLTHSINFLTLFCYYVQDTVQNGCNKM